MNHGLILFDCVIQATPKNFNNWLNSTFSRIYPEDMRLFVDESWKESLLSVASEFIEPNDDNPNYFFELLGILLEFSDSGARRKDLGSVLEFEIAEIGENKIQVTCLIFILDKNFINLIEKLVKELLRSFEDTQFFKIRKYNIDAGPNIPLESKNVKQTNNINNRKSSLNKATKENIIKHKLSERSTRTNHANETKSEWYPENPAIQEKWKDAWQVISGFDEEWRND